MTKYTEEQLQNILAEHKKWLSSEGGKPANLYNADLRHAYLFDADLRFADLRHANLFDADLRYANLSNADLTGANLICADLIDAKFSNTLILGELVNKAPLQLHGLPYDVLITDTMMQIGCQVYSIDEWLAFTVEEINAMESDAKKFYDKYGAIIQAAVIAHRVLKEENKEI